MYFVLRILNKSCRYAGESINVALSFFLRVERLSQLSLFRRILALFWSFWSLSVHLKQGCNRQNEAKSKLGRFEEEWSYSFKGPYGWRYLLTNFSYMFCPWNPNKEKRRLTLFLSIWAFSFSESMSMSLDEAAKMFPNPVKMFKLISVPTWSSFVSLLFVVSKKEVVFLNNFTASSFK